ncbi:MAG: chromate efflux transporter [Chloroflexota bacterium]|nr:chromate efflux transporter [Aggregatilineaceae bacterium]HMM27617.1 chromate efflux transporter [Aggregatilineaceae bacterium]
MPASPSPPRGAVREVAATFLRIGLTAFGGPAAHIAIMRHELVERRKWVSEAHFLDLLGATNLIPGPNSSEMTMHLGFVRAGWRGLLAGGVAFLLPAMLIVLGIAWAYVEYGATPAAGWLLYGIKPVIIPLIALALWSLGRAAVKGPVTVAVGIGALALDLLGVNFVAVLLGGGAAVMLLDNARRLRHRPGATLALPLPMLGGGLGGLAASSATGFSLWGMALIFLKIGALLYGSGYVLFAYMQADLVQANGWLTEQQLLDAIAIGQFTPGPLSASATFVGYILGGVPGALLATAALYAPAFLVVALSNPLIPRIRNSRWASGFLDGVNVAALALMIAVTWELGQAALVDPFTLVTGAIAAVVLVRWKLSSAWVVLFGAAMGLLSALA